MTKSLSELFGRDFGETDLPQYQKLMRENEELRQEIKRYQALIKLAQVVESEWRSRYAKTQAELDKLKQQQPTTKKRGFASWLFEWY